MQNVKYKSPHPQKTLVGSPEAKEIQQDGRIKLWKKIPEARNEVLRVNLLEDGETVHNAFFDRDFKITK
jgi:hypothetical protein